MKSASESLDFERAAQLRDRIGAIRNVIEGQKIAAKVSGDEDAVAFVTDKDQAYVQVFFVRGGKLIGRESFVLTGTNAEEPQEIMASFVKQYYNSATDIPPLLLLQHPIDDKDAIRDWLRQKRNGPVAISVPRQGSKKELVQIVAQNAEQGLKQMKVKQFAAPASDGIGVERNPGKTGAAAVCRNGWNVMIFPISRGRKRSGVWWFLKTAGLNRRITAVSALKPCPKLTITRCCMRSSDGVSNGWRANQPEPDTKETWAILPDLVLIDGGKGQLHAAQTAMKEAGAGALPIASLAKENEEVFIPGRSTPIVLPRNSPGLQLVTADAGRSPPVCRVLFHQSA